jgi:hypothetical protein
MVPRVSSSRRHSASCQLDRGKLAWLGGTDPDERVQLQAELRVHSTRVRITPTSLAKDYSWGVIVAKYSANRRSSMM